MKKATKKPGVLDQVPNTDNNVLSSSHPAYLNFINSLKTAETKYKYAHMFCKYYLSKPEIKCLSSLTDVLKKDPKTIEYELIQIITEMKDVHELSYSSIHVFLAAALHFFEINDIILNKRKLKKFKGENVSKYEYRSYTHEEISKLLEVSDERSRVSILLMASTGMRVGALADLKLKHLKRWEIDDQGTHVYQITVYPNTPKSKYKTFCTPECAKAIDIYLELRKRYGENIKQDSNTGNWLPLDTPLFIQSWNKEDYCNIPHIPKKVKTPTLLVSIVSKLEQSGLRTRLPTTNGDTITRTKHRNELHPCHSLRIFAVTNMQRSKVDKTIREMIVGHSTGLDAAYYKPQEEEILTEYLKAVDNLTINNEFRLKKQVEYYKQKADTVDQLKEQFEKMEAQFKLINSGKGLQ